MIKASGITKTFDTAAGRLDVLKGIELEIDAGQFVAIVGASGAGKSTLLHIMGTLDTPSTGTLIIDGQDISQMDEERLTIFRNRTLGFVFQFHHLMPEFTALENVMMPALISGMNKAQSASEAGRLLDELGLTNRLTHRPGELSGGEQQRVAVARALVMSPKVVLADEPTGNLDTKTGDELFGLLREINSSHNTTVLMVTHNEALSAMCDKIIVMEDGIVKV